MFHLLPSRRIGALCRGLMRFVSRTLSTTLVVTALCWSPQLAIAKFPLSNDPPPLAVCQDVIRVASLKLASTCRRAVSACLTRGIECVAGPETTRSDCCQQASARCHADLGKVTEAIAKFERMIVYRRCGDQPF